MSEIINLDERRAGKDRPDADCIRKDEHGRELYLFALEYQMTDGAYAAEVWAYDWRDAENRIAAMRETLVMRGQMHSIIPS